MMTHPALDARHSSTTGLRQATLPLGNANQGCTQGKEWISGYAALEGRYRGLTGSAGQSDSILGHAANVAQIVEKFSPEGHAPMITAERCKNNGTTVPEGGNMPKMPSEFGKRLRAARKLRKMTQVRLGQVMGVPQSTISTAEISSAASMMTAQLATVLRVNPVWLATGEGEMEASANQEAAAPAAATVAPNDSSYLAECLARMLDDIKDEHEKNVLYAHCVLLLTRNPVLLQKVGLLPEPAPAVQSTPAPTPTPHRAK